MGFGGVVVLGTYWFELVSVCRFGPYLGYNDGTGSAINFKVVSCWA